MSLSKLQLARRAALRLLTASAAIALAVVVFRFGLLPLISWALQPGPEVMAVLRRGGTLACVLLAYAGYVHWVEQRPVSELRLAPLAILLAAVGGVLLISITTGALFALGHYQVTAVRGMEGALSVAGTIFTVAMFEEVVFRGLLFRILEDVCGTWLAFALQSLLFGAIHLLNIDGDGLTMLLTLVGTLLVGAMWTGLYITTRNLWVCGANHAAWNLGIVATGVPLSGLEDWRAVVPLESTYHGPVWMTGGVYGPEASVICIALTTLTVAALVAWARRLQHAVPTPSRPILIRRSRP